MLVWPHLREEDVFMHLQYQSQIRTGTSNVKVKTQRVMTKVAPVIPKSELTAQEHTASSKNGLDWKI